MRVIIFILFCWMFQVDTFGQIPPISEAQAQEELSNRGITDEELKARLRTKGYDLDNIQPEQIPNLESVIQETLNELEAEKASKIKEDAQAANKVLESEAEEAVEEIVREEAENLTDEIDEAVREGASLEEAISEELSKEAKKQDPPATIYGQQIFRNQSLEVYRSAKDIKPPETYVLGPGDELVISIFGISQAEFVFKINENGFIQPSRMPRIYLKGIALSQARKLIRQRFSQYYVFQPEQFILTVNTARTITVNIFGEVQNFGSFTISAINTAFNALVAAGGPTDIGTIRKIKLIRGRETKEIDVYDFLFDPTVQYDFFLQNNDIIHVPTSEKLVAIAGGVKRPYRYELLPEENLRDLIKFAGGLKVNAYKENIQVTRIVNEQKVIIDVNLNQLIETDSDFDLQNGDVIQIRNIPGRLESFTDISGAVEFPDRYELVPNMRVSDLLNRGVLREDARTDVGYLLRANPDNSIRLIKINIDSALQAPKSEADIVLERKDKITILSNRTFTDNYTISVQGAVRNPIDYPFDPMETISVQDAITLAGGLKTDANTIAYIKRTDLTNNKVIDYISVDVFDALENPEGIANIKLQPKDVLTIYKTETFTDAAQVYISGEVRNPGSLDFDEDLRVSDVIYLSGGLTKNATSFAYVIRSNSNSNKEKAYLRIDLRAALINKESKDNITIMPEDKIEIMSKETFIDEYFVEVKGAIRKPGQYQYDESLGLKDVITLAGGLTLSAASNKIEVFRVVINENQPTQTVVATFQIEDDMESLGEKIPLEPFDIIVVRSVPDFEFQKTVQINGEVLYPGEYALINDNEKISDLLIRAGGFTKEAFPEGANLIRSADNIGTIILELDKALKNTNNKFNYVLKENDIITIPKTQDLVTIDVSGTLAAELYPDKFINGGKVSVAYNKGKRAEWYLNEYTAGINLNSNARRRYITVESPNGRVNKTTGLVFTPKVKKGSIIKVGAKPPKPPKEKKEKEPIDWGKIINDGLALAASVLTVLVLAERL